MPKTLLLADDSVVIQKLVGLSFANEDLRLVTTDNGDDALARAHEVKPDLVLADIVMPGISGYEVCEAIKRDPELHHIPVLLLTGTFEAFDEERAQSCGSDGHITKPFEAQALVERVNALLTRSAAAAAPAAEATPSATSASLPGPSFDFFDDAPHEQSVSTSESAPAGNSVPEPPHHSGAESADDVFAFGEPDPELPPLESGELLSDPLDFGSDPFGAAGDRTVALMPDATTTPEAESAAATLTGLAQTPLEPPEMLEPSAATPLDAVDADLPDPLLPEFGDEVPATAASESDSQTVHAPTTVIMSEGDSSSDGVHVGETNPIDDAEATDRSAADALLDHDLFADSPAAPAQDSSWAEPDLVEPIEAFDFGEAEAPFGGAECDPFAVSGPSGALPPAAAGYDVSCSDLGAPLAEPFEHAPGHTATTDATPGTTEPIQPPSDAILGAKPEPPQPLPPEAVQPHPETLPSQTGEPMDPLCAPEADPIHEPHDSDAKPDITPVMRARIHETLERVAWEAFSDISDTLVKQVLERVEAIAWEVIPQMAETLVKEEIRRMKGEDES